MGLGDSVFAHAQAFAWYGRTSGSRGTLDIVDIGVRYDVKL